MFQNREMKLWFKKRKSVVKLSLTMLNYTGLCKNEYVDTVNDNCDGCNWNYLSSYNSPNNFKQFVW